jgi:hypothetical protein
MGSVRMRNAAAAEAAAETVKKERRDAESVLVFDSLAFDMGAFGTAHLTPLILSQIEGGVGIGAGLRVRAGGLGVTLQRVRGEPATKSLAGATSCVKLRASRPGS